MSKRNVTYIKPDEPAFLQKIKREIGYKEGPTVDTKRQKVENLQNDSDEEEQDDEKPEIVVLNLGDLTAAEVEQAKKEEAEKPADLQQKIVFKWTDPKIPINNDPLRHKLCKKAKKAKAKEQQSKLSFDVNEEEDDQC